MLDLLFVYGTLMRPFRNTFAQRLRSQATFLGEGQISGYLFDLGSYPTAQYQEEAQGQKIHGEVYQLQHPQLLADLDYYEGYGDAYPQPNLYLRIEIPVIMGEVTYRCWFYQCNQDTKDMVPIPSGNYLAYLKEKGAL